MITVRKNQAFGLFFAGVFLALVFIPFLFSAPEIWLWIVAAEIIAIVFSVACLMGSMKDEARKNNEVIDMKKVKRLGNDYVGEPILLAFDEMDVAQESLLFLSTYLEKHGIKLGSTYDHLFTAIHDPHYGHNARKEVIDLMNSIAPKGCSLKEVGNCVWGFA